MGYPQPRKKFLLVTGANNVRMGGVVSQVQHSRAQVVAYFSKSVFLSFPFWNALTIWSDDVRGLAGRSAIRRHCLTLHYDFEFEIYSLELFYHPRQEFQIIL
jgi:hypothetical protein